MVVSFREQLNAACLNEFSEELEKSGFITFALLNEVAREGESDFERPAHVVAFPHQIQEQLESGQVTLRRSSAKDCSSELRIEIGVEQVLA